MHPSMDGHASCAQSKRECSVCEGSGRVGSSVRVPNPSPRLLRSRSPRPLPTAPRTPTKDPSASIASASAGRRGDEALTRTCCPLNWRGTGRIRATRVSQESLEREGPEEMVGGAIAPCILRCAKHLRRLALTRTFRGALSSVTLPAHGRGYRGWLSASGTRAGRCHWTRWLSTTRTRL